MIEKNEEERWNVVTSKKMRKDNQKPKIYTKDIKSGEFCLLMK